MKNFLLIMKPSLLLLNAKRIFFKIKYLVVLMIFLSSNVAYNQTLPYKVNKRLLVMSGGGARGAWGIGVAEQLVKKHGGYKAVFGTSTGSLCAPLILLQKFDLLEQAYTTVDQKGIFNVNPFKIDTTKSSVTTNLKITNALWRLLCAKPTLGESKKLRERMGNFFSADDYATLKKDSLYLAVAVTNMRNGNLEIKNSTSVKNYDTICNWIWASANEPLWMSYYPQKKPFAVGPYVDGGLRAIVPLLNAVDYAIINNIDSIDVIVNNSYNNIDNNWVPDQKNKKGWLKGLERILSIYDESTLQYSIQLATYYAKVYDLEEQLKKAKGESHKSNEADYITISIYFMDTLTASSYQSELGFFKSKMQQLLKKGQNYDINHPGEEAIKGVNKVNTTKLIFKMNRHYKDIIIR